MPIIVVDDGALRSCSRLSRNWDSARSIGLYSNQPNKDRHVTIEDLEPATFSGYDGERPLEGWGAPVMDGDRAVSYADLVTWVYDGGDPTGYVAGYYVTDSDGALLWFEPRKAGPVAMVATGQEYPVSPVFTCGTRFGGET